MKNSSSIHPRLQMSELPDHETTPKKNVYNNFTDINTEKISWKPPHKRFKLVCVPKNRPNGLESTIFTNSPLYHTCSNTVQ